LRVKLFILCESPSGALRNHLEHFHRTSTKNYKEIGVNPSTLGRVHFSGKIGTTQPCGFGCPLTRSGLQPEVVVLIQRPEGGNRLWPPGEASEATGRSSGIKIRSG
jgi:hypothetical protein